MSMSMNMTMIINMVMNMTIKENTVILARRKFYNTAAWAKCRAAYIQSVFGICERCGKIAPHGIVHHKTPITDLNEDDPNVTLSFGNLEFLCLECHNREHFGSGETGVRDGLTFDDAGQLVQKVKHD